MRQLITILLIFLSLHLAAQDLHFSQFYDMPLLRNPSLAGMYTGKYRLQSIYRNQWQSVATPYRTTALGVEYKFTGYCIDDKLTITGGFQFLSDQAGTSRLSRNLYAFNITSRMKVLDNLYIASGFLGGYVSNGFQNRGLSWSDQFVNGEYSPNNPTAQPLPKLGQDYAELAAGITFSSGTENQVQWYAGLAGYHLQKPVVGFGNDDKLPRRISVNGGLGIRFNEDIADNLVFYGDAMFQGGQRQTLFGAYYTWYVVQDIYNAPDENLSWSLGGFYRFDDAIIPMVRLNWDHWTVGLTYDFNVSGLSTGAKRTGSFECMLKFRGFLPGRSGDCIGRGCFQ